MTVFLFPGRKKKREGKGWMWYYYAYYVLDESMQNGFRDLFLLPLSLFVRDEKNNLFILSGFLVLLLLFLQLLLDTLAGASATTTTSTTSIYSPSKLVALTPLAAKALFFSFLALLANQYMLQCTEKRRRINRKRREREGGDGNSSITDGFLEILFHHKQIQGLRTACIYQNGKEERLVKNIFECLALVLQEESWAL